MAMHQTDISFQNHVAVSNQAGSQVINGDLHIHSSETNRTQNCVRALFITDPRTEQSRIETSRDKLVQHLCTWVLDEPTFKNWWTRDDINCLWINGGPGRGKTMMAMTLIKWISNQSNNQNTDGISYFFCQGTDNLLNNAVSVLRGLLYVLIDEHPSLRSHLERAYDVEQDRLFDGVYGLHRLWDVLVSMINDTSLKRVCLVVDGLDECSILQTELLELLIRDIDKFSSKVKWLILSRDEPKIRQKLAHHPLISHTSLDINSSHVEKSVEDYVDLKIRHLEDIGKLKSQQVDIAREYLIANSQGIFLWVALVCKRMEDPKTKRINILKVMKGFPMGLGPLYQRMMEQITEDDDLEMMISVMKVMVLAYRPLQLTELQFFSDLPEVEDAMDVQELVESCGSFFRIRDNVIYFVHQSAQEYLSKSTVIFPTGLSNGHREFAHQLLRIQSGVLHQDMCQLHNPGLLVGEVDVNDHLQAYIQYTCRYWSDHLLEARGSGFHKADYDAIRSFLCNDFLHWIEALSLMKKISQGILAIIAIETYFPDSAYGLSPLIYDAKRFMLHHRHLLDIAPMQVYSSALLFSPTKSLIRQQYMHLEQPATMVTGNQEFWSSCLQTLRSDLFSDGSIMLSPDGQWLASASHFHDIIQIWDVQTGECHTRIVDSGKVISMRFSLNSKHLHTVYEAASKSTIQCWDVQTGECLSELKHSTKLKSPVFSPDGRNIASGSGNTVVHLDSQTKRCQIIPHSGHVTVVAFSPNGRYLAAADEFTINIWVIETAQRHATMKAQSRVIKIVAFSPDSQRLASCSGDGMVELWTMQAGEGQVSQPLVPYDNIKSVVFSPDGQRLATSSENYSTIFLWDAITGEVQLALQGHASYVNSIAFSSDGQHLASASTDRSVRLWNVETGRCQTILNHPGYVQNAIFSLDSKLLASNCRDYIVRLWDLQMGESKATQDQISSVLSIAFSADGQFLALGFGDSTIALWDVQTGECQARLQGHSNSVSAVAFSPDGRILASGSDDHSVKLWDLQTKKPRVTFVRPVNRIITLLFSPNGDRLAVEDNTNTVWLYDIQESKLLFRKTRARRGLYFAEDGLNLCTDDDQDHLSSNPTQQRSLQEFTRPKVSIQGAWIKVNGTRKLWIPPSHQPHRHAIFEKTVAMSSVDGKVTILRFQ